MSKNAEFSNVDLEKELRRSKPDYTVYVPRSLDGSTFDTGNEHFLVFDGPDGSLMAVWTQSTYEGAGDHRIVFSRSDDDGITWTNPAHLLRRDHALPILQPLCCCPIYQLNDGRFEGCAPEETDKNHRPAFITLGEFRAHAEQPIWFSSSTQFMDNDGVGLGPRKRKEIGVYPSLTGRKGNNVLWHPDRKFFLLGKKITSDHLSDLRIPE